MRRLKVLAGILKRTRADKILVGFIVFLFAVAAVIELAEPDINRYGDALWYCYAVISTAGFWRRGRGNPLLEKNMFGPSYGLCDIFVTAIVTGVVVNFYTQMVEMQRKRNDCHVYGPVGKTS